MSFYNVTLSLLYPHIYPYFSGDNRKGSSNHNSSTDAGRQRAGLGRLRMFS